VSSEAARSGRLRCLWMDLTASVQIADASQMLATDCEVLRTQGIDPDRIEGESPDFIVLEFDYPSRTELSRACALKQHFSRIPMVVVTVQHSEALAVWFFRQRFYDYLVQPISAKETAECMQRLRSVISLRSSQEVRALDRTRQPVPQEAPAASTRPYALQPAVNFIERNYHQRMSVAMVASVCNMPAFRFGREFKETFGIEFRDYVLRFRIREACRLLRNPNASVTEVGYSVGFSEPSYFTKMFKKLVGCPPSAVVGREDLDVSGLRDLPSRNYQHSV
jgi:AraC-like DNA-binding protein